VDEGDGSCDPANRSQEFVSSPYIPLICLEHLAWHGTNVVTISQE
jgi:hypothetical protein